MASVRKKTALIIDDSEFMRALIKKIFINNHYRVVGEAENGQIGAEKYRILKPDIVTTDIIMGEVGGMAALELIMKHDPDAKIIVVSSMIMQKPFADEALSKGAKALVSKPVDENILMGYVNEILANKNEPGK